MPVKERDGIEADLVLIPKGQQHITVVNVVDCVACPSLAYRLVGVAYVDYLVREAQHGCNLIHQVKIEPSPTMRSRWIDTGKWGPCELHDNKLGVEGWTIIFNALRDSPTSKITEWNLQGERLGPAIAKPLAEYLSVTTELTMVWSQAHEPSICTCLH